MPRGQKRRTPAEKEKSSKRLRASQRAKYTKLMKLSPGSKDFHAWEEKLKNL